MVVHARLLRRSISGGPQQSRGKQAEARQTVCRAGANGAKKNVWIMNDEDESVKGHYAIALYLTSPTSISKIFSQSTAEENQTASLGSLLSPRLSHGIWNGGPALTKKNASP